MYHTHNIISLPHQHSQPHAASGRPRLESIDGARKWLCDVPKNATISLSFVKDHLKKKKKAFLMNRINPKMQPKSFSPAKNTVKIYMEELTMNPDEPLGITEKPYHKTEVRITLLVQRTHTHHSYTIYLNITLLARHTRTWHAHTSHCTTHSYVACTHNISEHHHERHIHTHHLHTRNISHHSLHRAGGRRKTVTGQWSC